ncbi:hypothetical protein QE152_g11118 [Popillia japonica]|uniref:Harbinger transposase-derived nuclease n=1 Tax=Popillia japonica TaxID=7064 RepID=A0AAW1LN13_POPJA
MDGIRRRKIYSARRHVNTFLTEVNETRGCALTHIQQMEVFLRSLADPGFQQGVSVDVGIHQTTVSKIIDKVSRAICSKKKYWIKFPTTDDMFNIAKNEWAVHHAVPNVIGAIDCTHVQILKPFVHGQFYCASSGTDADVIMLTETWLSFDPSYVLARKDRSHDLVGRSCGGGVLVAVSANLNAVPWEVLTVSNLVPLIDIILKSSSDYLLEAKRSKTQTNGCILKPEPSLIKGAKRSKTQTNGCILKPEPSLIKGADAESKSKKKERPSIFSLFSTCDVRETNFKYPVDGYL